MLWARTDPPNISKRQLKKHILFRVNGGITRKVRKVGSPAVENNGPDVCFSFGIQKKQYHPSVNIHLIISYAYSNTREKNIFIGVETASIGVLD